MHPNTIPQFVPAVCFVPTTTTIKCITIVTQFQPLPNYCQSPHQCVSWSANLSIGLDGNFWSTGPASPPLGWLSNKFGTFLPTRLSGTRTTILSVLWWSGWTIDTPSISPHLISRGTMSHSCPWACLPSSGRSEATYGLAVKRWSIYNEFLIDVFLKL